MSERLVEVENDVYLGSFSLAKQSRAIETTPTVGVAQTTVSHTDYHYPLTDGEENGQDFMDAVEQVRSLSGMGRVLLYIVQQESLGQLQS